MKNKTLIKISVILIIIVSLVLNIGKTYSLDESTVYTRKELQDMVLSTALTYYYNAYYSDYGQNAMDGLGDEVTEDMNNYYKVTTLLWRDLTKTPEMVGRSNYYHIDCSGFTFNTYLNSLGYDMSKYKNLNYYMLFYQNGTTSIDGEIGSKYAMTRVSNFNENLRQKYYREAYKNFGAAWNTGFLPDVANNIIKRCSEANCDFPSGLVPDGKNGKELVNDLTTTTDSELVYYYIFKEYEGFNKSNRASQETINKVYDNIEDKLQIGDIVFFSRYKSNGKPAGHVMLYTGTLPGDSTPSLIHATAAKDGDYNSSETSELNKLKNGIAIQKDNANTYVNYRIDDNYKSGGYMRFFMIFRPINTMCTSDNNCKLENNVDNVELSKEQLNNTKARVELKKLRREQWMTESKDYNNSLKPNTTDTNSNTSNVKSNLNSINVGDKITYNLRLTNQLDNTLTEGLNIQALIPKNSEFVDCTYSCHYEDGKLTWNNQKIEGGTSDYKTYKYTVIAKKEGTLINEGFKITTNNNELQFSEMKINVEPTYNGINKDLLEKEITKFEKLVDNGKITYTTSSSRDEYIKDLDTLASANITHMGFVKMIYYNAYGLDLENLDGKYGGFNTTKIKEAIFKKMTYPEYKNNGKEYVGDTTTNVYAKLIGDDVNNLTGVKKKISDMLVPGMYGGRKLKGNDNKDRIKFLRSFKEGDSNRSDLEYGDIIISFKGSKYAVILYLGLDEYGPVLAKFESSGKLVRYTDKNLDTYYNKADLRKDTTNKPSNQILNELFDQDLFLVLRPSKIGTTVDYNYNGGIKGESSYVAHDTYKNLVTPKKNNNTINLVYNNDSVKDVETKFEITHNFAGWYSDKKYTNKVTEDTSLATTKNHEIYAKWNDKKTTLPRLEDNNGKFIEGWYKDASLKTKISNSGVDYTTDENITLYAKWVEKIEITSDNLGVDNTNFILHKINSNTTFTNLKDLINANTTNIKYLDKEGNILSDDKVIKTGDVIKLNDQIEYKISVIGDIAGDGEINLGDVSKLYQYLKGKIDMDLVYQKAGDVTYDNEILINDVAKIYSYIKGKRPNLN